MPKKPPPNRTMEASCFVRMPGEDRDRIEAAIAKLLKDVPGAKMGVGAFMLRAAVEKAKQILGEK